MKKIISFLLLVFMCCISSQINAEQLNEGFEATTFPPTDWVSNHVSGANQSWQRITDYKHSGSGAAYVKYGTNNTTTINYLITPKLQPAADEELTFYVSAESYAGTTLTIEVSETEKTPESFTTVLATYTTGTSSDNYIGSANNSTFVEKKISLSEYVGKKIFIAFHVVDKYGGSIYLDDVQGVTISAVTCSTPAAPVDSALSAHSATLAWTKDGKEKWALQYKVSTASEWTIVNNITDSFCVLSALTANTAYVARVKAICGTNDESEWSENFAFTTPCDAYSASELPYVYGFEDVAWSYGQYPMPSCWDKNPASGNYPSVYGYSTYAKTGNNSLCLKGSSATMAILPPFETPLNKLAISFFYYNIYTQSTSGQLELGYITNNDPSTFTRIGEAYEKLSAYATNAAEGILSAVPDNASNLAFRYTGSSYSSMDGVYIDDITIEIAAACAKPTDLAVSATTPDGATLTWDGAATDYQYGVVAKDADAPTEWTLLESAKTVTINGKTAGTAYDFYVRSYCSASEQSNAVKISFTPVCPAPTAPAVSAISTSGATLSWTAADGIAKYQYVVMEKGAAADWSAATEATTTEVALAGLASGTGYTVYVRSFFSATSQSAAVSVNFNTECEAKTIGWSEDFDATAELPACWSASSWGSSNNQWYYYSYSAHSGSNQMRYRAYSSSSNKADLLTPSITLTDKAVLNFFYINSTTAELYMHVEDKDSLMWIFDSKTSWTEKNIELKDLNGKTVYFIFRGYGSGSSSAKYLYIDDVKVDYAPVAAPTEFTAVAGNASATISWAAAENITWNLQYRAQGDEKWKEVNGLTTNTYALEGIVNGVTYDVKVQAVASANRKSEWAATTVTPVDCPTVTEVTFGAKTYNSVVVNWTATASSTWALRYSTDGGENWLEASTAIANQTYTLSGLTTNTAYKIAVKPTCGSDEAWVIATEAFIPAYTEPVAGAATAITDAAATVTWTGAADATVYEYDFVIPGKAANWKETTELTATATDLKAATEYLFVVRTKYATGASQADTTAFATIAIAPKELAVSAVSANSATLIWANDGYADKYEWAVGNDANALLWNEVAAATKTLDELSANTAYTFYVRSKYSEDVKSDSIKLTFRTECATASALAWTGGTFEEETAGEAPRCWTIYSPNAYPQISTWYPKSGTYHLYFDGGGKANSEQIAALPAFSEDIKTLKMSFYYYNHSYTSSYYPSLEVGVMSDLNDSASFRTLVVLDKLGKYASEATEVLFNSAKAEEKYIAFRLAGGTYNGRAIIDNITFSAAPTCFAPELGETTILPDGATFTWTAGNGETNFQYALDTTETLVWKATDATSATIHGLTPGNSYKFYVRAACGETEKSDSVFTAFVPVCNAPSEAAVSAITTTGATLSWTAAAGIAEYQYVVMAKGQAADWSKATKVSTSSVELTALAANTGYTAYVRSYYNETIQSTAASINFRTECAAITALPWNENFEGQDLDAAPACWDLLNAQAADKSSYPYIAVKSESGYYQDAQALFFRSNGTKGYAILPALPLTNAQISFWHKEENGGSALVLGYLTNAADAESFVALLTCDLSTTGKNESAISLAAVPAGARLAFQFAGKNYYYDAAVDNILVEEIPACAVPTGLAASEISDTSAKLAWTSEATAFALQFKADTTDADWQDAAGTITNPYVLEGLLANTKYYVQVKAVCDGEHQSEFCETINFTTECAALTELNETFADGKPECWKGLESSNWTIEDGALKYKSSSFGYFTTQAVNVTMADAVLSFNIKNDYYNYGTQYRSGMVTITTDGMPSYETNFINSTDIKNVQMIDLSAYEGKTITITFEINNATKSSYYVYLDNVKIGVKPCDTPKNLSAVAALDSVVLAWEQGGDETTYQYCVVEKDAAATGWMTLEAGVRTVTVKGLTTDKPYDAYVRSFCGEGREGETALKATFIPVCPQPSALEVTAVGAHSATLSWTAAAGITKYQYTLVENEWLEANIVEATSVDLNDLDAAKTYTFYVRAYHNATSVSAAISKAFTTDCDVLAMPFVENFNTLTTGLPTCWENKESNGWKVSNNGHEGACVRFDSYTTENGFKDTLSTPQITISGKEPVLMFWYKNRDGGAYTVAIDNGVDTTALISEGLTGVEQWTDTTVSLTAYIGKTVRILFLATSNSAPYAADVDAYLYLDDVQIIEKPEDPTAIENIFGNGKKAIKRVENGQLVIEYNGVIYNAQGTLIR